MQRTKLPTYFISHGGGPWPYLPDMAPTMAKLKASLEDMARELGAKPKAVLVITGHWEERDFTVSSNPNPGMVYDYSGFPSHTYQVKYAAPGSPALAERVVQLLTAAGLAAKTDAQRGFDHGTFTPLVVMYPDADVPVVQLSLRADYDPAAHLAAGKALAPLRDEGVLIVGSGLSYHNLREFGPRAYEPSHTFDKWLREAVTETTAAERAARLVQWAQAPAARRAHPEEDHLLPLMVAAGAAGGDPAITSYHEDDFFGGMAVTSFRFGSAA